MSATITTFPNPDEVVSDEDAQYAAGVAFAEQVLTNARAEMQGKDVFFISAFWDVIYDVFDDGE